MNQVNLQQMSDEELLAYEKTVSGNSTGSSQDLSKLSDDELLMLERQVSQGQSTEGFTTATFQDLPSGKSPLNPLQEVIFSGSGNDKDLQFKALQQFLPDSEITVAEDGDFMVDGARLNPAGFDFGDITRNLLDIIPLTGQVVGSVKGAALGTMAAPGAGTVGGAIVGGTVGATAGRTVQLALGDALGLDVDGKDYLRAMQNEAQIALTGEVLGAGLYGAGKVTGKVLSPVAKKLAQTKMAKGASNLWVNTLSKLKKSAPAALEYLGGVDQAGVRRVLDLATDLQGNPVKHGQTISQVLAPDFFRQDYGADLSSKLLFGETSDNLLEGLMIGDKKISGALRSLVNNVQKNKGKTSTKQLIQLMSDGQVDDSLIDFISRKSSSEIFSATNLDVNRPLNLAKGFVELIEGEQNLVGNLVRKAKKKAIEQKGLSVPVQIDDIVESLDNVIRNEIRPLVPFGKRGKLGPLTKLQDIVNRTTRQTATGKAIVKETRLSNALKLDNLLDDTYEVLSKNKNIPSSISNKVFEIKKAFNKRIDDLLELGGVNQEYSMFMEILEGTKLDKQLGVEALENRFKSYSQQSQFFKNAVSDVLTASKTKVKGANKGLKLLGNIEDYSQVKKLLDFDSTGGATNMFNKFNNLINSQNFVSNPGDSLIEKQLKSLGKIAKAETGFDFFEQGIMNKHTAKLFDGTRLNQLRINSILNMALGGIAGFSQFGPLGAVGGLTLASQLTPKNIAAGLVRFDKMAKMKAITKGAEIGKKITSNKQNQAMARALLGRLVAQNN